MTFSPDGGRMRAEAEKMPEEATKKSPPSLADRRDARDRGLAAVLSMGFSIKECGTLCKCSRDYIQRRLRDPGFRARLRKAAVEYAAKLMNTAVRRAGRALQRLEALAADPTVSAAVRTQANKAILDFSTRSSSLVSAADEAADVQDTATEQCPL